MGIMDLLAAGGGASSQDAGVRTTGDAGESLFDIPALADALRTRWRHL